MKLYSTPNQFGDPIGLPVGAVVRPGLPDEAIKLSGQYCYLEVLDADKHAAELYAAFSLDTDGRLWPAANDEQVSGLGLVDAHTVYPIAPRSVGEVQIAPARGELPILTGFENHQGFTQLGPEMPALGRVLSGVGNGYDQAEGVWHGNVIGTYMHGPALARNPELADAVLQCAIGPMARFDDELAILLAQERRQALKRK